MEVDLPDCAPFVPEYQLWLTGRIEINPWSLFRYFALSVKSKNIMCKSVLSCNSINSFRRLLCQLHKSSEGYRVRSMTFHHAKRSYVGSAVLERCHVSEKVRRER